MYSKSREKLYKNLLQRKHEDNYTKLYQLTARDVTRDLT